MSSELEVALRFALIVFPDVTSSIITSNLNKENDAPLKERNEKLEMNGNCICTKLNPPGKFLSTLKKMLCSECT